MNNTAFHTITSLQYNLKHAQDRIQSFESGAEYRKLELRISRTIRYYERKIRQLEREVEKQKQHGEKMMGMWFQVFEDIQEECSRRVAEAVKAVDEMSQKLRKKEEKQRKLMQEVTETRAKVLDEKEKNQKLQAQVSQNFENSSVPSSQDRFRGKVPNNRVSSGRNKGGQEGHEGHKRKPLPVTEPPIFIDAPDEIKNNPDYYRQSGPNSEVHKQVAGISFEVTVRDYYAYVYRNRVTGAKYHAPFPEGVQLDVNYDETIKGLVFILRNHLNVSIDKTSEFLREMTDGKLNISHGKICGINEEFARKTEAEQKEIFSRLCNSKVMYTDMTNVRQNGKLKNVVVCSNKTDVFYAFKEKKGDQGLKGTPVEYNVNLLVHDHDKTFYHYGTEHQECNSHHMRYLRGAMENEKSLTWHSQMLSLLGEMNKTRENQGRKLEPNQIEAFRKRYDIIINLAEKEYYDNPPSRYYRKGYNLFKELRDYKESTLRFLTDPEVDFCNNEAERSARKVKRHTVMSGSFRGEDAHGCEEYCKAMTVFETDRKKEGSIFDKVKGYFKRVVVIRPKKKQEEQPCPV